LAEEVSAMADPAPDQQDDFLHRLRLPAALLLAFLLMVGAYYTLHYQTNARYLASRNFRLLATLGSQVSEAVKNQGMVSGNVVCPGSAAGEGEPAPKILRALESSDGTYRLVFKSERVSNKEVVLSDCGGVELKGLLDPLFSSREAFDAVLLANGDGKVVYLHGPKSLQVEQLDLLIQNRHVAKAAPAKGADGGFKAFQGYSGSAEVELGDRRYTTFVQPFRLPLAFGTAKPAGETNGTWLLAGLVANDKLQAKSLALSPSSVAFLLGLLLLAALAWPLAKLKMLGERQRVKKTDVLLVGACSLLGASVATLFVLDLGAYRALKSSSEMQLKDFAEQMEGNLLAEIRSAYDQLSELERINGTRPSPEADPLPPDYLAAASYPHLESFSLIDGTGRQIFKRTAASGKPPLIDVADRLYFQKVHQGLTLTVPEPEPALEPVGEDAVSRRFFLESVKSWTNGKWQAVIAKPADQQTRQASPPAEVAALAIQMLSVIDPVIPPGFEFAVVGDDGTVLFNSDSARNLAENFFEETDHDRRFASIVLARHDEPLDVRYWGESYRAMAIPVKGLPWTIVAMRNQQVLEKVNLDWLVTALILVLLYTGTIIFALAVIALLRPGYRAGWAWPDSKRPHDYARLIMIFGVFCLAFAIALFGLRGTGFLFMVAGLLPLSSFVAAYLTLSPDGNRTARKKRRAAAIFGVLLLALLGRALVAAPPESGAGPWIWRTVLALAVCAFLLAAGGPQWWRELRAGARLPVSRSYPALGLLLVLLAAVMPTAGFFKVAHRLQVNSFVRNGQLNMAKKLHDRVAPYVASHKAGVDHASTVSSLTVAHGLIDERPATLDRRSDPSLDFYGWAFFDTRLSRPGRCEGKPEELEPLADVLPPYSAYTAESRELLHNQTSDDDWKWCESAEGDTVFDGENYLGVSLVSKVEPASRGNGPFLAMAGFLPPPESLPFPIDRSRPATPPARVAGNPGIAQAPRVLLTALVVLSFGALLYALVAFVARRVFLLDVQEPLWAGRTGDLPSMVGANVLLISRTKSWRIRDRESFFCMSFRDLDESEKGWPARRLELVCDPNRNVLVEGLEHRAFDPAWNARKLQFLEEIVFVHQRAVVVLSELSPAALFSSAGVPADPAEDRWRNLLASFTQINEDVWPPSEKRAGAARSQLSFLREIWNAFHRHPPANRSGLEAPREIIHSELLRQECGQDPFLKRIGLELDPHAAEAGREQLLEELGERAQGYYGVIWTSCSRDERVVLGHLAEEGLVNAKNRRIVRRLMARGLIQRDPNLCLMNETFRRFVVSPACRDQVLSLEQAAGRSAWDRFHWPFSAALAACAALILITQQELLDSTVAAVTGVTAGLPTLLKLLDLLGWKRGTKSA
jgi:hypothetical protein